ncbi:hypothetical protein LCGC14_2071900, partial [marine sediment metagenome]
MEIKDFTIEEIKDEIESIETKMTETRENFNTIYTEMRNFYSDAIRNHQELKNENEEVNIKVISDFLDTAEEKIRGCDISSILEMLRTGNEDEEAFSKFEEYNLELKEVIDDINTKKDILENFKDKIEQYESKKTDIIEKLNEGKEELLVNEEEGDITENYSESETNNLNKCYAVIENEITNLETDFAEWLNSLEDK